MDVKTERVVNEAIRALDITRIIIAHRPETIRTADRVLLLEGGATAEVKAGGVLTVKGGVTMIN